MTALDGLVMDILDKFAENYQFANDEYDRNETNNYAVRWILKQFRNIEDNQEYLKYYLRSRRSSK